MDRAGRGQAGRKEEGGRTEETIKTQDSLELGDRLRTAEARADVRAADVRGWGPSLCGERASWPEVITAG